MEMKNICTKTTAAVFAAVVGCAAFAATDLVWTGGGDGCSWNDAANWDGVNRPGSDKTLVFNNGGITTNDMGNISVYGIKTDANSTIDLSIGGTGKVSIGDGVIKNNASANIYFYCPVECNKLKDWNNGIKLGPSGSYGLYFRGGLTGGGILYSSGQFHLEEQPCAIPRLVATSSTACKIFLKTTVDTTGQNKFVWGSTVNFLTEDALRGWVVFGQNDVTTTGPTVDLGGYDQTKFSKFETASENINGAVKFTSDEKAKIVLEGDDQFDGKVIQIKLEGKAGFVWNPSSDKTVTFAAHTQTTAGALGVLNGTMVLTNNSTFTSLERLTVGETGTFKVVAGGGGNFHADELVVTAGATFNLASGVALNFGSAKLVDDQGEFIKYLDVDAYSATTEGVVITGGGSIVIQGKPTVHSSATWDAGGGASTGLSVDANWQGDVKPDLASGGLTAIFDSGSVATVDTPAIFEGVSVTTNTTDFTFAASGDNGMTVLSNGIAVAEGASARTVSIEAPLSALQAQTWTVPGSNDTLSVSGGFSGVASAPVSFAGKGKLTLAGEIGYLGKLTFMPTKKSTLRLNNADLAGSLLFGNPNDQISRYSVLSVTGDSAVRGFADFHEQATLQNSGRLVLAGGVKMQGVNLMVHGAGTYVITNSPFKHTAINVWFSDEPNTTELWVANNIAHFTHYNGSRLYCKVPYALRNGSDLVLGVSAFDNDRRGWLYMEGDQRLRNLTTYPALSGSGAQEVYSATHSKLILAPNANKDCFAAFLGGASYSQNGQEHGPFTTTFYKASTSTGTVSVASGTLVFAAATNRTFACSVQKKDIAIALEGGSWTNASLVAVGAGGTIKLTHGKTFGKQTVVEMTDTGKMQLDAGVLERVAELWIDGAKMPSGDYGSTASGAATRDDTHFEGAGRLQVGTGGFILIFR